MENGEVVTHTFSSFIPLCILGQQCSDCGCTVEGEMGLVKGLHGGPIVHISCYCQCTPTG